MQSTHFQRRSAQFGGTWLLAAALVAGGVLGPNDATRADGRPEGAMADSNAEFVTWRQGFEHDTSGWYDAATEGPLGWCGAIEQVSSRGRGGAALAPSAGSGYATIELGFCNGFWSGLGVLFGAPYGPGPELALYSDAWPASGYVTELDVWLDPAWSDDELLQGSFAFAGSSPNAIIQYAATVFPTDWAPGAAHTGPHYFAEVLKDEGSLTVADYPVATAGWYTFRFVFSDDAGAVRVDFELADRSGGTLAVVEDVPPVELWGPAKIPFVAELPTAEYGSGHVWFFDVAFGLRLPIDEHRVRRGR